MRVPVAECGQGVHCEEGEEDEDDDGERAHERQTCPQQRQIREGQGKNAVQVRLNRRKGAAGCWHGSKISVLSSSHGVSLSSSSSLDLLGRNGKLGFGEHDPPSKRPEFPASTCGSVPASSQCAPAQSRVKRYSHHHCVFSSTTTIINGALASRTFNQPRV